MRFKYCEIYEINYNDLDGLNQVVQHDGYKAVRNIIMDLSAPAFN